MFDSIVSGLASLFGSGAAEAAASEVAPLLADPVYSFGVSGAGTDILGNAVDGGNTFFDSAYSLGVPGMDDAPLRPSVFDLSLGGAQPLGYLDASGHLVDLSGAAVKPTSFGGFNSNLSSGASPDLDNFLDSLRRGTALTGGSGGGGGTVNIAAPSFPSAPAPDRVSAISPTTPAQPQGSLMSAQSAPAAFSPLSLDTRGQAPEAPRRGLEELFERDPFADVKARMYGGR